MKRLLAPAVAVASLVVCFPFSAAGGDRDKGKGKPEKPAAIPADSIRWARSWEEAIAEATERNVPIHCTFHKDHCGPCEAMDNNYTTKDYIAASKLVVNIYCHNETDHANNKKYGSEEWCEHNYGQKCEEHTKNHAERSSMFFKGTIMNPTTIWLMPDGTTEISRKTGVMPAKEFNDMLKEAEAKVGGGLSRDEYAFIKGKLKAGADASEAGKLKDAIEAYTVTVKTFGKNPNASKMLQQVRKRLDDLNQAGLDAIAAAKEEAAAGRVDDAKKALKLVYAGYKGLECAKLAEKELAALK